MTGFSDETIFHAVMNISIVRVISDETGFHANQHSQSSHYGMMYFYVQSYKTV